MAMPTIGLEPSSMCKEARAAYDYVTNIPSDFEYPQVYFFLICNIFKLLCYKL